MLRWDFKTDKIGTWKEKQIIQGEEKEFTYNLYSGNALLISCYEFEVDGVEKYQLVNFYADIQHMKNCLGLTKGYDNIHKNKEIELTLFQDYKQTPKITEAFEINEQSATVRPWFTTAAGVFASAVNEMLLQSDENNIYLLPATPKELQTVSFKLLAKGGAIVEADIKNGELKKLDISFLPTATPKEYNIYLNGKKIKATK